jgi:hypothetical protein
MDNTEVFFRTMQLALGGTSSVAASLGRSPADAEIPAGQRTAADRLINLSSRGVVGSGDNALINGFVLAGSQPHRLLIRGVGPTLGGYGVSTALPDPRLRLTDGAGTAVAVNDDWETNGNLAALRDATTAVGAFALANGSKDAALLVTLSPGKYTVELSSGSSATGVALLEVYELP